MPNGANAVLTIVAVACCSVAVPLDPRLSQAEFDQRLDMLRLNALLVPQGNASEARQAAERRRLAIIEAVPVGHGRLGINIAAQVPSFPAIDAEPDPGSPAFILQTSGTTAHSHCNMLAAAARLQAWFGLTHRARCLSVSHHFRANAGSVSSGVLYNSWPSSLMTRIAQPQPRNSGLTT